MDAEESEKVSRYLSDAQELRRVVQSTVPPVMNGGKIEEEQHQRFSQALKRVKTDVRGFPADSLTRPAAQGRPCFGMPPLPPNPTHRLASDVVDELARLSKRAKVEEEEEKEELRLLVKQEGDVMVVCDKARSFKCIVRSKQGFVIDAYFLRYDEDAGKNYGLRNSKYKYWRKATEEVFSCDFQHPRDLLRWVEARYVK